MDSSDKVYSIIKKKLLQKGVSIVLASVDTNTYRKVSLTLTRYLVNEKRYPGIYVTTNLPYPALLKLMEDNGINTKAIIFVDLMTNISGVETEKSEQCFYLDSPQNLTDLSIALTEAVSAIPTKEKFIIIDSLSTLVVYNEPEIVTRFVHFLVNKMRKWSATGVIIVVERAQDKKVVNQIFKFFDTFLDFTKGGGK